MEAAFSILIGPVVALLLDWSIYGSLRPYLQIGVPGTPRRPYRQLAFVGVGGSTRTAGVVVVGVIGGVAIGMRIPSLVLVAGGLFGAAHLSLYLILYRRM